MENELPWTDPKPNDPGTRKPDAMETEPTVTSNQEETMQDRTKVNDNNCDEVDAEVDAEDNDKDDDSEAGEAANDWVIVDLDYE